ncbi:MAG: glycoside hydrolase family 88 protein, partial [Spirochaetia bacterium]|nr:glycoside hydrolase family 88 protein [Spirochaetia bacterium]
EANAAFAELKIAFTQLAATLSSYQDASGMWRQIIDEPSAPAEFSCTAMIGTAFALGIQKGWLDEKAYQPRLVKAWEAIVKHTLPAGRSQGSLLAHATGGGEVLDVCESTGRMGSKDAYLNRKLIRGFDDRGGSLALLFAVACGKMF